MLNVLDCPRRSGVLSAHLSLMMLALASLVLADLPTVFAADATAAEPMSESSDAAAGVPGRSAYFGDLHIHTMYSFDAFTGSVRTTPDDAYRYAKGEPIAHPAGMTLRLEGPPVDFLMVSDDAWYLGIFAALLHPSSPTYGYP
ncbi:MAG: DUF3604 domain-containing protein, partial [Pseudomonadales bacterium]|nr:DUF3604 domain-containing protein [Pseudomonadales bacterium]